MPHQCTNCGRAFADGSKEMLSGCPDCGGNKFQFRPASAVESTPSSGVEPAPSESTSAASPDSSSEVAPNRSREEDSSTEPTPSEEHQADSAETTAWPNTPADVETGDATEQDGLTDAAARAGAAVRDRLSRGGDDTASQPSETDDIETGTDSSAEDSAQATARSDVVSHEELSAAATDVDTGSDTTPDPDTTSESELSSDPDTTPESETASGSDTPPESDTAPADTKQIADTPADEDKPDLTELRQELNDQFESIKIVSPGQYELNLMELYDRDEYIISLQEDGRYVIEVPDRWREDE